MKALKLKPEFEGLIISKNIFQVGTVTFDFNTIDPKHYHKYQSIGFDIFEEVTECRIEEGFEKQCVSETEPVQVLIDLDKGTIKYEGIDQTQERVTKLEEAGELTTPKKRQSKKDKVKQEPDQE